MTVFVSSLLPPELTEKILTFVSPADLLSCCSVSRLWRERLGSLSSLWQEKARSVGCNVSSVSPDWRLSCVSGLRISSQLESGRAWSQEGLVNLVKVPGRFSALDCAEGHIAGGTADSPHSEGETSESVVIWSVPDSRVSVSFHVSSSVSCIKLSWPRLVVCGHFGTVEQEHDVVRQGLIFIFPDGTLSSHSLTGQSSSPPGSLLNKFRLHTAPVLALDISLDMDLLASGSADGSTKLWQLSSGSLVRTLSNQSHWVLAAILCPSHEHCVPRFRDKHLLLSMTRDDIQLWSWAGDSQDSTQLSHPDLYIPLKCVTDAIQSFFFTPGLHFDGRRISFIRQMPMFDTQTIGDADIVILDANTGKVVQSVHVNQKIRKLLAIGSRFAVLLLPCVDNKYKNLAVVDLEKRQIVGGCVVPHSRASTPDFSQICLGDKRWLDGHDMRLSKGLVAALALADSSIQIVTWKQNDEFGF